MEAHKNLDGANEEAVSLDTGWARGNRSLQALRPMQPSGTGGLGTDWLRTAEGLCSC